MPERREVVPLQTARIADLRFNVTVEATCRRCRHTGSVSSNLLRDRLSANFLLRDLGEKFRCTRCGRRGAAIDARRALEH